MVRKFKGYESEHEGHERTIYANEPENVWDLEKRVNEFCINHTTDIINVIVAGKDNLITFIIESGPSTEEY